MIRVLFTTLAFVLSITILSGLQTAQAQEEVESLSDFVGARAGQAENALKERGYTWIKTDKSGDSAYSYWTEDSTGKCVTIRTSDGQYKSIVYAPDADCQADDADAETVIADIESICRLKDTKKDQKKYKGKCSMKHTMSDGANTYFVELGDGSTYKFTEQGNGYQVKADHGMSEKIAAVVDHGNKTVFKWGKWKLTVEDE